ncbi:MAG: chemotaxis protein CheW [Gammaproteobacteria bacterium]|jgi:chemosensory pili system protein ChpC|nr:chemotaxis protein CheW [Gammaproteobacteria bacterium]MDP6617155.1 chemotaxis protein CheW [Gammaproteobacteria bacterium]MDP6695364.1 chemotaxis protein CheW [Gammaproteobacteria bacterium]
MAVISEELYSLIVPLETEQLIVPRSCVAEIVRYSLAEESTDDASWLRGTANWNNRVIPVISFERMCGIEAPVPGGRTRIVVFHPLGVSEVSEPYGLLAEGFPQMVRVNKEVVEADSDYEPPPNSPVICQVRLIQEHALIPDLEMIEQMLREVATLA